jgi:phosphoglycolate phosphatase
VTIRGVLFDKDGTLLDYWQTWTPINREVALFAAGGDAALAAELLRHGGQDPETNGVAPGSVLAVGSHDEIAAAFADRLGSRTPPHLVREIERIFVARGGTHSVLAPDVRETLARLKQAQLKLGIATNDSIGGLQSSLRRHDLLNLFDFVAGCDSGHGSKPGEGMALAFCGCVGLAPAEAAVVGDAVHDLEMGRRAGFGMRIGVLGGTGRQDDLAPHADLVIASLRELPARLIG